MPTKTTKTTKTSSAVRKPAGAYRTGNQSVARRLTSSSSKRKAVQGDVSESEEIDETTMHNVALEKAVTTPHLAFPALPEPEELAKYEKIIRAAPSGFLSWRNRTVGIIVSLNPASSKRAPS